MIPFVDLKAQYRSIKRQIDEAVIRTLERSEFIFGEEVEGLEDEFARYCNMKYAVAINSGTSALHLALLASGIGPGDEVITVPFTFVSTVAAICYTGARPVLVDIDPRSLTMDVAQAESAVTARTRAILPVHLYGQPADMDPIRELAGRHNLTIIEDACQAHGARYKERKVGSLGHLACFSFYPSKNLGSYGQGGMVVTSNPEHLRVMRLLRDMGQTRKYHHSIKGFNYRMDALQAAILRVKLHYLDAWIKARRDRAAQYDRSLAGAGVERPVRMGYSHHVFHIYAVRSGSRDALAQSLGLQGIQTMIHYPIPVHLQEGYRDLGYGAGDFPVSERAANEVLSLPMYAELEESSVDRIVECLIAFEKNNGQPHSAALAQ